MPARRQEWEHGTVFGYDKRGCRCEACRQARRTYDQARYATMRAKRMKQVEVWREANREKTRGYVRAQYARDPEKAQAFKQAWRDANPDAVKAMQAKYRQTEKFRIRNLTTQQIRRGIVSDEWTKPYIAILLNDPCSYCGGEAGTVDHVVPVNDGGSEWDNLTAACGSCNSSKNTQDLLGFLSRKAS